MLWPGTQRTQEKEEAERKNRMFLLPAAPPGAGGGLLPWAALAAVCLQAQPGAAVPPGVPRLWCSRASAGEGEGGCSQGPVSVGEGRDIKIPPALLALFEIEL